MITVASTPSTPVCTEYVRGQKSSAAVLNDIIRRLDDLTVLGLCDSSSPRTAYFANVEADRRARNYARGAHLR